MLTTPLTLSPHRLRIFYYFLLLLVSVSFTLMNIKVSAAEPSAIPQIRQAVAGYLDEHFQQMQQQGEHSTGKKSELEVTLGHFDPRLRLAPCQQPLTIENSQPMRSGHITVKVRCQDKKPWSLFVAAQVKLYTYVVVAAKPLARRQLIGKTDLRLQRLDTSQLPYGYFTDMDDVIGLWASRPTIINTPIVPAAVEKPIVVERGDDVLITARIGQLEVRSKGTALSDGRVGEQIRIRNKKSERIVRGHILGRGRVEITL